MQEREIIRDNTFYGLLYANELYLIRDKKPQQYINRADTENVLEQPASYGSSGIFFQNNGFQTLLLVAYPALERIPDSDRQFLNQVLQAVGLSFDKVSVLNVSGTGGKLKWDEIAAQSPSTIVIAFGIDAVFLPSGIGEGQIYNINNKRVLCAASLPELASNVARKKMLWQGLKEIYGI